MLIYANSRTVTSHPGKHYFARIFKNKTKQSTMYCSVYGCTSDSKRSQQKLYFFEFPKASVDKEKKRRKKWIEFCKRKHFVPTKSSHICSLHFCSDAYLPSHSPAFLESIGFSDKYKVLLKADAIPTEKNPLDKGIGSESKKRTTGILVRKKVRCVSYSGPFCLPAVIFDRCKLLLCI